jgi:2-iminobutanoate/2-iminopropanoate deaminase
MTREIIATESAPKAIGPYSQAVRVGGGKTLYCSGQIPLDPASGQFVGEGDIRAQAHQVLKNLQAVLTAAGVTLSHVAKTTIFLVDLGDFAVVNEIYGTYFATNPPARSTVQVSALPRGARIEIEAIAVLD